MYIVENELPFSCMICLFIIHILIILIIPRSEHHYSYIRAAGEWPTAVCFVFITALHLDDDLFVLEPVLLRWSKLWLRLCCFFLGMALAVKNTVRRQPQDTALFFFFFLVKHLEMFLYSFAWYPVMCHCSSPCCTYMTFCTADILYLFVLSGA